MRAMSVLPIVCAAALFGGLSVLPVLAANKRAPATVNVSTSAVVRITTSVSTNVSISTNGSAHASAHASASGSASGSASANGSSSSRHSSSHSSQNGGGLPGLPGLPAGFDLPGSGGTPRGH